MRSIPFRSVELLSSPSKVGEKMDQEPQLHRPGRHVSIRSLVGTILLIVGIVVWLILVYAIFEFSRAVGEFLEVVISLGNSAS